MSSGKKKLQNRSNITNSIQKKPTLKQGTEQRVAEQEIDKKNIYY